MLHNSLKPSATILFTQKYYLVFCKYIFKSRVQKTTETFKAHLNIENF